MFAVFDDPFSLSPPSPSPPRLLRLVLAVVLSVRARSSPPRQALFIAIGPSRSFPFCPDLSAPTPGHFTFTPPLNPSPAPPTLSSTIKTQFYNPLIISLWPCPL
ncbi:hypothetical protein QCA50_018944 [Cerrena zonata]|uniref:Secreted protein n=1 Tax=Cerrena zonata TaxID=2478898 RepID=A0AAW0FGH6_9APHY